MRKYNENHKHFPGSHRPPNPQLIIAIAARSFSQNSKKNRPANFSLFRPLTTPICSFPSTNFALGPLLPRQSLEFDFNFSY